MSRSQTAVTSAQRYAVWQATLLVVLSAMVQSGETAPRGELAGSISGVILEPTGPLPVANAQVDVVGAGVSVRKRMSTGANGQYLVSGLPPGSYRVVVTKSESERRFFTTHFRTSGIGLSFRDASLVPVTTGQNVTGINLRMIRRADFLGSIAGTVRRTSDGAPIGTGLVQVRAAFSDFADTVDIVDGHYRMDRLPAGNYFVSALAPGFARQLYSRALYYQQASVVTVPLPLAGGSVTGIDFALTPGGSVSGTIRRQADPGLSVPSAQVAIFTDTGRVFALIAANPQGSYRFDFLPLGIYRVGAWVAPTALQNLAFELYQDATSFSGATPVVLDGANPDAVGVDLTLPDGGAIAGVVEDGVGQPVVGASVIAQPEHNPLGLSLTAVAGADGSYRIEKLASGRYIVQAGAAGRVRQFHDGTLLRHRATPVDVGPGLTAGGIDFQLVSGRKLNGTVRLGTQAIDGARLLLSSDSAEYTQNARSNPDGSFSFLGVPALGDYRLIVSAPNVAPKVVPVDLRTADGVVNVTLEPGYTLAGRVFSGNGIPILGAAVELTHLRLPRAFSIRTDASGRFSFEHLPAIGGYRIAATGPNSSRVSRGNISLEAGDVLDLNLVLGVGRSISGRVTLAGSPLASIHVTAHSATSGGSGSTRTDANGNYVIQGLPPAPDYFVVAGRDSLQVVPRPGRVDLTAGNATGIDIDIPAGRGISGTVSAGGGPLARARVVAWSPTARRGGVAITDLQGAYRIEDLPAAGDYRLVAVHRGFAPQYYSGAAAPQDATPVDLSTTEATGVDFDLTPGVTLSGVVRDALGAPVGGAHVTVGTDRIYATARADSAGLFQTTAVAAGTYDVVARSLGQPGRAVLADVVVGAEPVTDLTLTFPAGGAIEGTVSLAGGGDASQAFVVVSRGGDQGFERLAQADGSGAYRVDGLPVGSYRVAARAEGYEPRAYPNATVLSQGSLVAVAAGSTTTGIDLNLPVDTSQPGGPSGHLAGAALVISSCSVAPGVWASSTTVTLGWEPVEDAHGYNIAFDHSDTGSLPTEPAFDPEVTSATSEILEDGIYYAHVRSFAITWDPETGLPIGFEWQDDTAGPFLLDTTAPASPDGLSSTSDTGQIVLSWIDPATDPGGSGLDRVQVQRDVSGFPGSPDEGQVVFFNAAPVPSASEVFTDSSVVDGQMYFYSVFAIDAAGNASIPGAQVSEVASPLGEDPDPPEAPTKPAALVTATKVILNWKNPNDTDLQGVEIRYSKQGPFAVDQGQVLARINGNPGVNMSWTHQNPGPGLHYYGIYAFDAAPNYSEAAKISAFLSGNVPADDLRTLVLTGALLMVLGVRAGRRRQPVS